MRAVAQRVTRAVVRRAEGQPVLGSIGPGLVLLLGVGQGDQEADAVWLLDKLLNLRIFADPPDSGNMNRSLLDVGGELLIVSQFTLYADCRKGRRPSFTDAMPPAQAEPLYQRFVALARATPVTVATGAFGAMMHVELVNDGPVTICLDTGDRKRGAA